MKPAIALCSLLFLAAPTVGAQDSPAASLPTPIFGETVEVRVVNLEVVVTDEQGLPVTGLTAEDFRLLVDGEPVPIGYFTEVRGGTAVVSETPRPEEVVEMPDVVPGEPVGTSYLVFVDDFFSVARDRDRVLTALSEDLGRLKPEDRMAIVAYDGETVEMLSTWSDSRPQLERALREAMRRPTRGLERATELRNLGIGVGPRSRFPDPDTSRLLQSPFATQLNAEEQFYARLLEQQVTNAVSAVRAALRGFANPPGRKVLLLMSGGWPYEIDDYVANQVDRLVSEPGIQTGQKLFSPLIDTANQVGYTIFAIDVPGMGAEFVDSADRSGFGLAEEASVQVTDQRYSEFLREHTVQFSLLKVAGDTGGEALLNAQRMSALEIADAATRSYYWLGFQPTWQGDDRRHEVDVEVLREDMRVSSRDSFVDFSRSSEVSAAVESVLLFGGGPGVLPLELEVGTPEKSSGGVMVARITVSLPAEEIALLPVGEVRVADLELRVAATDERGGRSDVPVIPVRVTTPVTIEPGARVRYQTAIELRRIRNRLVVSMYDPGTGNLWAATTEVKP